MVLEFSARNVGPKGLAVIVQAHVEGLDLGGVVGHERGALEVLLGEEALVLGLQVDAPAHGVIELVAGGDGVLEDLHGLGVGDAREVGAGHMREALDETLVHELVEHGELVGAAVHDVADDVLQHVLGEVHVVGEVGEGDLGLDHPELGGMARGVGVLGTERGAEGVDVAEGHGEVLGVELAGHGQRGGGAEEVLAEVHVAVLVQRRVGRVDGGDVEHLAGALAVARGDDGGVHVDEAAVLEEAVDGGGVVQRRVGRVDGGDVEHLAGALAVARGDDGGVHVDEAAVLEEAVDGGGGYGADAEDGAEEVGARTHGALAVARGDDGGVHVDEAAVLEEAVDGGGGYGADAEDGAEEVGARTQVLLGAQELDGGALLLQRVVRGGGALDHDLRRRELEGLRRVRGELELAGADERGGDVLVGDLVVVLERLAVHDDLQVLEAAAVVQGDEAEVLHVADGLDPSGDGDGTATEGLGVGVELGDLGAIHAIPFTRESVYLDQRFILAAGRKRVSAARWAEAAAAARGGP